MSQMELFDTFDDKRVEYMRYYFQGILMCNPKFNPTAKELVEIGDQFGVIGSLPLTVYLEEQKSILKLKK
jgi:hypothetical protein